MALMIKGGNRHVDNNGQQRNRAAIPEQARYRQQKAALVGFANGG